MIKLRIDRVKCEECGKSSDLEDICFVFIRSNGGFDIKDKCKLWCTECQNKTNPYYLPITTYNKRGFLDSPEETIDWLQHLNHKGWFNPQDFMDKMDSLRGF